MPNKLILKSRVFLKKNSSTILTYIGAVGVVGAVVSAVKSTPKAMTLINNAEKEKLDRLTIIEKIKVAGPAYIPAAAIGATTIACIFASNIFNKKTQASLASAYAIANQTYNNYRKKAIELYGEDVDSKIREAIMKNTVSAKKQHISIKGIYTTTEDELDYFANKGTVTFYDLYSDRYFESTAFNVLTAEHHLNRNFSISGVCDLNDFYEFLGIDRTTYGDSVGWSMECGYTCIDFHHKRVTLTDGMEVCVIEYDFEPYPDYVNPDYNYCGE